MNYSSMQFHIVKLCVIALFYKAYGSTVLHGQTTQSRDTIPKNPSNNVDFEMLDMDMLTDDGNLSIEEANQESQIVTKVPSFWKTYIFDPSRWTMSYELTYKFTEPDELIKNRFALRAEYSKFLFNNLFVQLDAKIFAFLDGDSRSRPVTLYLNDKGNETEFALGSITRNAFVQYSFGKVSFSAGIQTLAWGESDFAAVTDEINPFDLRDPLNLNIDEIRLGQFMTTFNVYTSFGNWNFFWVPDPRFNELPKEGTEFYVDPYGGQDVTLQDADNGNLFEYGMRWKKTFGKSDVSIIATSLMDNTTFSRQIDTDTYEISKKRFYTVGTGGNYAIGNLLLKGEAALKLNRTYTDTSLQLLQRNAFDATVGFEYSLNSTATLGLELINSHIVDWNDQILGFPKNDFTAFFIATKELMKGDLALNYISMFNAPNTTYFNLLSGSYNWTDNIVVSLDAIIPITQDPESAYYQFREQQHLAFKIQFLF